jgi:2-hydroxychromene-2-carboxylate isomerase
MRVATFAQQGGRAVAYSLAAFRQAFAGGRDLSVTDNVLIAAAACELHPNAVLKALDTRSVKDRLRAATEDAYARGVRGVPTVRVGDELFWGDDRLEDAAAALASS